MASKSPHALLQVMRQFNGMYVMRIQGKPRFHRIVLKGVSSKDGRIHYNNTDFQMNGVLDVPVELKPTFVFSPSVPVFANSNLTSFPLTCQTCQAVLANPRPEYIVRCEDTEALMEAASGCCRYHKIAQINAIKRSVNSSLAQPSIEIDNGCLVVNQEYLNPLTVSLNDGIVSCNRCNVTIGRKRGLTGQLEFEPILADFDGGRIVAMFDSQMHYFSTRLVDPESHAYTCVCDYRNKPHILISNQVFRTAAIVNDTVDSHQTAHLALSCLYTVNSNIVEKNFGSRVYFPDSIVAHLKNNFSENNELLKSFKLDVGIWKSSMFSLK